MRVAKNTQPNLYSIRFYLLVIAVLGLFVGLIARAFYLQVGINQFLSSEGKSRFERVQNIKAHRGIITDRHGVELAVSVSVESVWLDPATITKQASNERAEWPELAALLGLSQTELNDWLARYDGKRFVYLRRHLDPLIARHIQRLDIPGVHLSQESRRYYPTAEITSHIVGFTNIDDAGQEGVELAYEEWLRSESGSEHVVKDRRGRVIEKKGILREAQPGDDLSLSIDSRIQAVAYGALKAAVTKHGARSGAAVLVDVATGEILSMVSQPAFNPNRRHGNKAKLAKNIAVTDMFEPGSTVKPFTVISALMSGLYTPETTIDTSPGIMRIGRNRVRDVRNYGVLDISGVIKKSSNIGVSRMALKMTPDQLQHAFYQVGFGIDTGIGFPGESTGNLTPKRRWSRLDKATFSYGYGFTVTTLQLAQAYAVLGSYGLKKPLSLLKVDATPMGERVLDATVTKQVITMMEQVVADGGTGTQAQVPGYRVAGKTGTVRKAAAGGYSDEYIALFAGLAPADKPRLAMAVMVDEPAGDYYYGGQVAAPVFAKVMQSALRLVGEMPAVEQKQRIVQADVSHHAVVEHIGN